jgi:uncharacterized membrane-anchored protein YhcB (DUF1043 family)
MKRSPLPAWFYVTLVFVSGLLVGAFAMRLYYVTSVSARQSLPRPSADEVRRSQLAELQSRFNLTAEQSRNIDQVFEQTRAKFKEIHQKIDPEMKQLRKEQGERVRAFLTPDQQTKYDAWRTERDQADNR